MKMGVECELPYLTQDAARLVDWCSVDVHDDGSIRNQNYTIDNVSILPMHRRSGRQFVYPSGAIATDTYGAEIVTEPYEYEELRQHVGGLARMYGHIPTTPRASIHVHVDVIDRPWRYVQNLVRWFLRLEAPLFRLSALGEVHRGYQWFIDTQHGEQNKVQQDHNYARPLSDSIGIKRGARRVPLIDWSALTIADSATEFVAAWGRLDLSWGKLTRYCPHRLHALNLVPLMTQHTVEWRLFNGRYRYLPKVLEIVHAMHRLAETPVPDDLPAMPFGTAPDFNADAMSRLLDVDVSDIWGYTWLPPCLEHSPDSHYKGNEFTAPSVIRVPCQPIFNNLAVLDRGLDTFCFGVSQRARGLRQPMQPMNVRINGDLIMNLEGNFHVPD